MDMTVTTNITLTLPQHTWGVLHRMLSDDFGPRFAAFQSLELALKAAMDEQNASSVQQSTNPSAEAPPST